MISTHNTTHPVAKTPTALGVAAMLLPPSAQVPLPPSGVLERDALPLARPSRLEPATCILSGPRCKVKGCVFPASVGAAGMCHLHALEEEHPELFESLQPILGVLEQAKYGISVLDLEANRAEWHAACRRRFARRHGKE